MRRSAPRNAGHGALESERSRLHARVVELEAKLAAQLAAAETERTRLTAAIGGPRARPLPRRTSAAAPKSRESRNCSKPRSCGRPSTRRRSPRLRGEQAAQIARLQSEAETHEQEMAVLMAHLQEARRPIQSIEADVKRLTEALAAKDRGVPAPR